MAIKQNGQVSPRKFRRAFCFLFFLIFFFKYHAFNWNNPKEWWWHQDFTQNCIPVDSINNPAQFHTSATRNLVKSCASTHCIPPKHLCLWVTCETLAKGWKIKTQMKAGRKKTVCKRTEMEAQNNYANNAKVWLLYFLIALNLKFHTGKTTFFLFYRAHQLGKNPTQSWA